MSPEIQGLLDAHPLVRPTFAALLPVAILTVFGIVALLADLFELGTTRGPAEGEEGVTLMAPYLALIGTGLALVAVLWQAARLDRLGGAHWNGMIVIDGFGLFLAGVILAATLLTLLLTIGYCRRENIQLAEYYHLILMAAVGMVLLAQARNLVMVFVALELMSVAAYILTGFLRRRPRSIEGALKYFVMGAFSTGFLVYGIALVYGMTGSLDLAAIGTAAGGEAGGEPLFLAGLALLIVGFGFKVAVVPFHMWSPDVYEAAPPPITGFMATGVKAAGFAAFVRVLMTTFDPLAEHWMPLLWVLAVLTMFVGNLAAIRQDDIKRMLAYSSIAHAGYLLVALVAHSAVGGSAFLYYLAAYTLMTMGAFGVVVVLAGRGGENASITQDYAGLAYRHPLLAAAMALFMFSLTGIPPTAGFVGKFYIFSASVNAGQVPLALLMVVASVISAVYYLRVVVSMYMGAAAVAPVPVGRSSMAAIALFVAAIGVLGLGLFPAGWIDLARGSIDGLLPATATLP